ncbi:prolipoprotein diacylglyceryl transferase, partial [Candidatus Peregrinibacteria bacterium]|nr:prolipoprotein diacylglyceryl transferase [Candidatus Peregrinibacteria bacterium]
FLKLAIVSIIGASIFGILENLNFYFAEINLDTFFQLFYIWDRSLSFFGAALAFIIYFFLLCKKNEQDILKWMDVIVPSVILVLAFANIGAFFDGSNYGTETSLPWGINFESPLVKYTVPIHPTQIYSFIYSIAVFAGLIFASKNEKVRNMGSGFTGILGLAIYNLLRFMEEFLRGDDAILVFGIRLPQIFSAIILASACGFLYFNYFKLQRKPKK